LAASYNKTADLFFYSVGIQTSLTNITSFLFVNQNARKYT